MLNATKLCASWIVLLTMAGTSLRSQTYLDTIIFGNSTSETSHSFVGPVTLLITNSFVSPAQTARRGL